MFIVDFGKLEVGRGGKVVRGVNVRKGGGGEGTTSTVVVKGFKEGVIMGDDKGEIRYR